MDRRNLRVVRLSKLWDLRRGLPAPPPPAASVCGGTTAMPPAATPSTAALPAKAPATAAPSWRRAEGGAAEDRGEALVAAFAFASWARSSSELRCSAW